MTLPRLSTFQFLKAFGRCLRFIKSLIKMAFARTTNFARSSRQVKRRNSYLRDMSGAVRWNYVIFNHWSPFQIAELQSQLELAIEERANTREELETTMQKVRRSLPVNFRQTCGQWPPFGGAIPPWANSVRWLNLIYWTWMQERF